MTIKRSKYAMKYILTVISSMLFLLSGCATTNPGIIYSNTSTPIAAHDTFPWNQSKACMWSLFGLISVGDASIRTAMRNGKLGRVAVIDQETYGVFGVFKICTIVYGPYGDLGPPDEEKK